MNENFSLKNINGVSLISCDPFEKHGVSAAFSTRLGGVSKGDFASLNLGFNRGDSRENLEENYRRFAAAVGSAPQQFVLTKQTHGDAVISVNQNFAGYGITRQGFDECDGLITNCKNLTLCIFVADCVPILLLDTQKKVIGAVHSGWKGTAQQIGAKAVLKMQREYGCDPKDIICAIGPSVGPCCFEIGEEVAEILSALPGGGHITRQENKKPHANLWEINRDLLEAVGILPKNIFVLGECTVCHEEKYFSHRRNGDKRGSLAAVITLP